MQCYKPRSVLAGRCNSWLYNNRRCYINMRINCKLNKKKGPASKKKLPQLYKKSRTDSNDPTNLIFKIFFRTAANFKCFVLSYTHKIRMQFIKDEILNISFSSIKG